VKTIEIPDPLYKALEKKAKLMKKSLIDVVIDSLLNTLDRDERIELYRELHEEYLKQAEELREKENITQSSEKYWRAITALLNIIGELKNIPHYRHVHYAEIIEHVFKETKDNEIPKLFASVERLHANYHHSFLSKESFELHRQDALRLIKKLKEHIDRLMAV